MAHSRPHGPLPLLCVNPAQIGAVLAVGWRWLAPATHTLFNQVAAFYFEVIAAHPAILDLSTKEALTALETLKHTTSGNPHPVMPLACAITADIPAMFRRAAIHTALGSVRSFSTHLAKWRKQKEKAQAKGKKFTIRPPVPHSYPLYWRRERASRPKARDS